MKMTLLIFVLVLLLGSCTTIQFSNCTINLSDHSAIRVDASKDVDAGNPVIPQSAVESLGVLK